MVRTRGSSAPSIHAGKVHPWCFDEIVAEFFDGVRFAGKVHLPADRAGEFTHNSDRIIELAAGNMAFSQTSQRHQGADVCFHHRNDAGATHLDDHILTGFQPGSMNLCNRSCGQRHRIDLRKELLDRSSQFGLNLGQYLLKREARDIILQLFKLLHKGMRDNIRPG